MKRIEGGRGRERKTSMQEKNTDWLPPPCCMQLSQPGIKPETWACALTGNQTSDLLVTEDAPTNWAMLARAGEQIFDGGRDW